MIVTLLVAMLLAQDAPTEKVYKIGIGVTQPKLVSKQDPAYTQEARLAGLRGTVEIQMVVGSDGTTRDFKVTKALGLGLDEQAIAAASMWKFYPGMKDQQPVAVYANVQMHFALANDTLWGNGRILFDTPSGVERPHVMRVSAPKSKPKDLNAVTVTFILDEWGEPGDFHVATPDFEIERAVVDALKEWRFMPAMKDGKPLAVKATVDFVGLHVD